MLRKSAFLVILVLPLFAVMATAGVGSAATSGGRSVPSGARALAFSNPRIAQTAGRPAVSTAASAIVCDGSFDVVASPNGTGHNDIFATSVVSANDVWAVGVQTNSSNYDRTLAEHWNGSTWTIVPTPNPGTTHNDLNGVAAISATDVWVVGDYWDSVAQAWLEFASNWNGSSWSSPTIFNYGLFLAVTALASNDVWVVGTTYFSPFTEVIEHWNGSGWSIFSVPSPGLYDNELFYVSAFASNDVWAVGLQAASAPPAPTQSLAEHWDGSSWSAISTPNDAGGSNAIDAVVALEAGHAVGVGYGGFVSSSTPAHGEAWNLLAAGTSTDTPLVAPGTGNNLFEGVAISGSSVWAVGFWTPTFALTSPRQTLAWPATWNASTHSLTWGSMGTSASPGSANNVLFADAAVSPSVFWGVGYTNSGGYDASLMESYCGLQLGATAPANVFLGSSFSLTVTAKNPDGSTKTGYLGTVHFTSTDTHAVLPSDYTFTPSDSGVHTFTGVVLNSLYLQTITAADTATPFISASAQVTAYCPGACPGPAAAPGSRGTNPSSPAPPGSRATQPSAGSGPPVPPGARIPRQGSTPTTLPQQGGSVPAAALRAKATSTKPSAPSAVPAAGRGYNVALPATETLGQSRLADATLPQPVTAVTSLDRDSDLGAMAALGLVALLLLSARRRYRRRRDADS